MPTKIFTPELLKKYVETRLFGKNVAPSDVTSIELHNSVLPSELYEHIMQSHESFFQVQQENGREPIFYSEGTLYIPQFSGHSRARRYQRMIEDYRHVSDKPFHFSVKYHNDSPRRAFINYSNLAYDFVTGMFMPDEKDYEKMRVFPNRDVKNIRDVIFGPLPAVAKQAEVIVRGQSEYLNCQIVKIGGKEVLNIDYVYGDQAEMIVEKMQREYAAVAMNKGMLDLNFYVFSRFGSLTSMLKRGDVLFPTGVVDVSRLSMRNVTPDKIDNCLADHTRPTGILLNCPTVVDETIEQLIDAVTAGCIGVELEIRRFNKAVTNAEDDYTGVLNVRSGYALHVSDNPLLGDTLADELASDSGEQKALEAIVEDIR